MIAESTGGSQGATLSAACTHFPTRAVSEDGAGARR